MELWVLPLSQLYFPKTRVGFPAWVFFPSIILPGSLYLCTQRRGFWNNFLTLNPSDKFVALDICEGYKAWGGWWRLEVEVTVMVDNRLIITQGEWGAPLFKQAAPPPVRQVIKHLLPWKPSLASEEVVFSSTEHRKCRSTLSASFLLMEGKMDSFVLFGGEAEPYLWVWVDWWESSGSSLADTPHPLCKVCNF